jgi:FkbM family methyltransferase
MPKLLDDSVLQSLIVSSSEFDDSEFDDGIYIYGAGDLGRLALEYCEANDITILGFVDKSPRGAMVGSLEKKYQVRTPDSADKNIDKEKWIAVAIATMPYWPIQKHLQSLGWKRIIPFYQITSKPSVAHPLRNGWRLDLVGDHELSVVEAICSKWEDDQSRSHYIEFLNWHANFSESNELSLTIKPELRYVIPEILESIHNREVTVVDVGGCTGESLSRFSVAGLKIREYIGFEPDNESLVALRRKVAELLPADTPRKIISEVLYEDEREVSFLQGLGYCSQIGVGVGNRTMTRTLDGFSLRPDVIKIHTEGSEVAILRGAKTTVERNRPILMFAAYHTKYCALHGIQSIMEIFADYAWFFRQHGYQGTGCFVYGVPRQKLLESEVSFELNN